jgi:hypothetical protein
MGSHIHWVDFYAFLVNWDVGLAAKGLQLVDGCRTVDVSGYK